MAMAGSVVVSCFPVFVGQIFADGTHQNGENPEWQHLDLFTPHENDLGTALLRFGSSNEGP